MQQHVISPVTGTKNTKLLVELSIPQLVNDYKELFGLDVTDYFAGHHELSLYECMDSKLQFFYPHNIVGDGKFYEAIQHFDWYYQDDKWEFREGIKLIEKGERVLEIGSGKGQFLKMLKEAGAHATGLELNEDAIRKIKQAGHKVHLKKIGEFEQDPANKNAFDVVCSFQVYEHIENIGEVIKSSLNVLKPNGKLIIAVPNSRCLYNAFQINPFNAPPHHQGLWFPETFKQLQNIFNIELRSMALEPLSFVNRFRLAATDVELQTKKGTKQSLQYLRSLSAIFADASQREGRTMLACFKKLD